MKVLWITNNPISAARKKYNLKPISGTWTEPFLISLKENPDIELSVATVAKCKGIEKFSEDGVQYISLPISKRKIYPHNSKKNLKLWKEVVDTVNPDLIMIWGTEYAHGYCALKVAGNIPSLIFIQGIIDSVARYYLGGMTEKELRQAYTLRNFIKVDSIKNQQKLFYKKAKIEKEMLNLSGRAINELDWAKIWCERIAPGYKNYECQLSTSDAFKHKNWQLENCEPHTIFCCAPNLYPLKGFHILIKAMSIVVKKYPNAKVRVPGLKNPLTAGFFEKQKRTGYLKYLAKLIKSYNLEKNFEFLGVLTPDGMAGEMERANVFVIPSSIENHSSSLREAMIVGTPCIASFVGGIPETVTHGDNALLYRFEDYESLANSIISVFSDNDFARKLGSNGKISMSELLSSKQNSERLYEIYKDILNENK